MSLELYHKLMQDEDFEAEEVVCEEGEECPVVEEEAVVEEDTNGSMIAAVLHLSVNFLQFALPLTFWLINSASTGFGGIFDFTNLWSSLLNLSVAGTHTIWYMITTLLTTLVFFVDIVGLWDVVVNVIGMYISALIALVNILLYVMVLALASAFANTRFYIDFSVYLVGQIGYFAVLILLTGDAKTWFSANFATEEVCAEEAQECVEAVECEDPEAEDCTYDADLALYEECTAFNTARDECIAAAEAAAAAALEEACASCEGDECPEDCPAGEVEEDEEEAFFF